MTASPRGWVFSILLLLAGGCLVQAQRHREPLTQPEIDQIRDASWEPKQRLTLYVQFARVRLVKLEQMRSDPKIKDRPRQTHDLLDDPAREPEVLRLPTQLCVRGSTTLHRTVA